MNILKVLLTIAGVLFICYGIYQAYVLSNQPYAVLNVGGAQVEILPAGGPLSVLSMEPLTGIRLRVLNAESVVINGEWGPVNGTLVVEGRGEIPVVINGEEVRLLFDSEGRFLALSTSGGVSVSGAEVSEEFSKAVLTYTVAPFVSGLAFTLGSLAIAGRARRRR